jgi:hypothetical protein
MYSTSDYGTVQTPGYGVASMLPADIPLCRDSIVTVAESGAAVAFAGFHVARLCPCFVTIPGLPLAVRSQTARLATEGVTQERTGLLF